MYTCALFMRRRTGVEDIANIYVDRLVMPKDPGGDALHLAVAAVHRVDVVLTWNWRHLAKPGKMEPIRLVMAFDPEGITEFIHTNVKRFCNGHSTNLQHHRKCSPHP